MAKWHMRIILFMLIMGIPVLAFAQASSVTPTFSWKQLVGVLINTAGVMGIVQVIKAYRPLFADKYGYLLPIIATALGPCLMTLQGLLTTQLGFDGFDFTPISAALTGTAAVAVHQVYDQAKNGPRSKPTNDETPTC